MGISDFIPAWSVARQLTGKDRLGLGKAAQSSLQANLVPRTAQADKVGIKSNGSIELHNAVSDSRKPKFVVRYDDVRG